MTYKSAALAATCLSLVLSITLALFPALIYWLLEVEQHPLGDFVARRASMLFLGLAALAFLSRNAAASEARKAICICFVVAMVGLAFTGLCEFMRGYVGPGIWLAISVELAFATVFFRLRDAA